MAYNLQSLITILEHILNPHQTHCFLGQKKPQVQSLLEKAASLQRILEKSSFPRIESLESQIQDLAHRAEDIIETTMVDGMLSVPQGMSFIVLRPDLLQVIQELDSVMEQVVKLEGKTSIMASGGASSFSTSKSVVVGVEEDLMQLNDRLTGSRRKLEIVPIVGMGGIGKTTLARNLYEDPSIIYHFKFRAWATISQVYNLQAILLSLLRCIIGKETDDQHIEKKEDELKDVLYKSLYGRRYMIVLDDIWSAKFWDEMRMFFPDNNNGSRIVITTRESNVAKHADSKSVQHEVQLLSDSKSWNLLSQIVFGEEHCPDHHVLQGIGRKIAGDCGGLPLAINVIGGVLSKVERSEDAWEKIGNDVTSAIVASDEHEQLSNILSLSYDHLSNHLRPCFLYMGAFPEDYEINGSTLIRMWIAEGFVKSSGDGTSLEEEAEDCLKALVDRNVVFVRRKKSNGKPMSYNMHDLLRDVCVRKADEEKFLHVVKNSLEVMTLSNPRRVSFHSYDVPEENFDSSADDDRVRLRESSDSSADDDRVRPREGSDSSADDDDRVRVREGSDSSADDDDRVRLREGSDLSADDDDRVRVREGSDSSADDDDRVRPREGSDSSADDDDRVRVREGSDSSADDDRVRLREGSDSSADDDRVRLREGSDSSADDDSVRLREGFDSLASMMPLARSFLIPRPMRCEIESRFDVYAALRLLRVLDITEIGSISFPSEVLRLVNLRYLAVSFTFDDLPREISKLWNLQMLIARMRSGSVPCEIWEMPELRHLLIWGADKIEDKCIRNLVQKNLKTISSLELTPSLIRADFFKCIPNIEKLALSYHGTVYGIVDLSHLHELDTLRFYTVARSLPTIRFPSALRKLNLGGCVFYPGSLTALSALPNLKVLKILRCWFAMEEKNEWEVVEGDEFQSLQFLCLEAEELKRWKADETNFPKLRHLCLRSCWNLDEIPGGIGEISTLELIELFNCPPAIEASAQKILEVQQSEYDNYAIQLHMS